jgi:nitroreductase/NAD-dependent dihydropyrimidine dehydrogenase PreA subunit
MMNFKVDKEKCVKCKICVADCPVLIIDGKTEFPEIKEGKEDNCLKCQHCLAVCPEGAISIWGKNPEYSIPSPSVIPKSIELENLIQLRRSVRRFKSEELSKELIDHLASIALYAPTAKNENAVQFSIIDNKADMAKLRELTYSHIQKINDDGTLPEHFAYLANFAKVWDEKQIDVIFRDAPHLLVASAPKDGTLPQIDCSIAMSYFDLLAHSNNIGTLWDGFAKYVFEDVAPELKETIGIPENHEVVMVLLFGLSRVKFSRSIQNDNPNIKSIQL